MLHHKPLIPWLISPLNRKAGEKPHEYADCILPGMGIDLGEWKMVGK